MSNYDNSNYSEMNYNYDNVQEGGYGVPKNKRSNSKSKQDGGYGVAGRSGRRAGSKDHSPNAHMNRSMGQKQGYQRRMEEHQDGGYRTVGARDRNPDAYANRSHGQKIGYLNRKTGSKGKQVGGRREENWDDNQEGGYGVPGQNMGHAFYGNQYTGSMKRPASMKKPAQKAPATKTTAKKTPSKTKVGSKSQPKKK